MPTDRSTVQLTSLAIGGSALAIGALTVVSATGALPAVATYAVGAACVIVVAVLLWALVGRTGARAQRELTAVATRLAVGDFSAVASNGSGQKAGTVLAALETVRANSAQVVSEMGRMSDAHEAGDIDAAINADAV